MKNEKSILISIIIMICIIIVGIIIVLGVIYRINTDNNIEKEEDITNLEEGGEEYTKEHLKDVDFEITNLSNSVTSRIKDVNQFLLDMKEYIYLNGLVQANIAECININESEGKIIAEFRLNDPEKTIITATINVEDNTYTFSDNYLSN